MNPPELSRRYCHNCAFLGDPSFVSASTTALTDSKPYYEDYTKKTEEHSRTFVSVLPIAKSCRDSHERPTMAAGYMDVQWL